MTHSRYRAFLGISSVLILLLSIYLLLKSSLKIEQSGIIYSDFAATAITSLNISILFAWFSLGVSGGIAISVFSLLITLWFALKTDYYVYALFSIPFFVTTAIGIGFRRIKNKIEGLYGLKSEKLDEAINILSKNTEDKKKGIRSLEEKLSRYSALKGVTESLSLVLSIDDINKLIIDKTLSTLGKPGRVLLFLVDTEKQELMLSASSSAEIVKAKKGDIFDQWVLRNRKSLIVEDVTMDFRFPAEGLGESKIFRSLISTPLVSADKVIGILRMDSRREFIYTQDDLRLLDIISDLGAVAINNALLYSKTQELAIKDGLTGLVLRRYFMERFQEEIKRAGRRKDNISFLMIDIDHFKDYNDKYGHTAGDLVLKYLAKILTTMTREGDMVVRYGGEEIAVLLYGKNKKEADSEAENIRRVIKDKPLMLRRHATNVTVSIGVSSYPDDAILEEELIRAADERLYKAKARGRDRVCSN